MRLLVVSDSHGSVRNLREVLWRQEALPVSQRAEVLLHLGDGACDPERAELPDGMTVLAVRGNCDGALAAELPVERTFSFAGFRILMAHGHTLGVKSGLVSAVAYAREEEADLLLFGHTHEPVARTVEAGALFGDKRLHVFNPGALAEGSFGLIELSEKGILMSHGSLR